MRFLTNGDNKQRSGPHRHVEKILEGIGIAYNSEEYFKPYAVDIYLPEWHLAVEIDGPLHNKKKDEEKDQYLLDAYGLLVLRIKTNGDFRVATIKESIISFIEKNSNTCIERKSKWLMMH